MADFFIRRPIVAMVIAILTVIVGLISLKRLPIAEYPPVSPTMIQVTTTYRGAAAECLELDVRDDVVLDLDIHIHYVPTDGVSYPPNSVGVFYFAYVVRAGEVLHYFRAIAYAHGSDSFLLIDN